MNCLKEGTYKCALEVEDEECKNYETVKKGDKVFGVVKCTICNLLHIIFSNDTNKY